MKKISIAFLLLLICSKSFSATWTVTNAGWHFTPDTLTITLGDSVNFVIDTSHYVLEISQSSWIADDTTPLPGFRTPFGGGLVLPAQLTAGTHWYICPEHSSEPMKAVIIVQNPAGITSLNISSQKSNAYPNPFMNKITIEALGADMISIYNIIGKKIVSVQLKTAQTKAELDASELINGIYFYNIIKEGIIIETKKIVKY